MDTEVFIELKQVSRYFGNHCAVKNLNFAIRRGEVMGFLGPNGAGKSTTMLMLTGNLAPSHGQILINGIDILDNPKQAKAHIGFLPEQPPLYRELSVDEYLSLCARLNRIAKNKATTAVNYVKERCGLQQVSKRLIANLSKGYQQRVGIAQAIIHSPDVVVLDEPTVGLDPIQIREIRQLIRDLGKEHSVILSSHILPEIQATCDRVQIINRGELVLSESVDQLQQHLQTTALEIKLRQPPALSKLEHIDDIERVEDLGNGRYRLHHKAVHNPAEQLAILAVEQQWGLSELTPVRRSLEQIFLELTTSEHNPEEKSRNGEEQAA